MMKKYIRSLSLLILLNIFNQAVAMEPDNKIITLPPELLLEILFLAVFDLETIPQTTNPIDILCILKKKISHNLFQIAYTCKEFRPLIKYIKNSKRLKDSSRSFLANYVLNYYSSEDDLDNNDCFKQHIKSLLKELTLNPIVNDNEISNLLYKLTTLNDDFIRDALALSGSCCTAMIYALVTISGKSSLYSLIHLLILCGANLGTKNNDGKTLLMQSVINNDIDVAKLLIARNADINSQDQNGNTAFLIAVISQSPLDILRLLINCGADLTIQNKNGQTAKDVAVQLSAPDIIKLIDNNHTLIGDDGETNSFISKFKAWLNG